MRISLVVAATSDGGIGKNGTIPWSVPEDMAFFKSVTTRTSLPATRNAVVMGRKTYESIPAAFRPLKGRLNVVLSSRPREEACAGASLPEEVVVMPSLDLAVVHCKALGDIETLFVVGGARPYAEALARSDTSDVYLTVIGATVECDTFFPRMDPAVYVKHREDAVATSTSGTTYQFQHWVRVKTERGDDTKSEADVPARSPAIRHEEYQYLDLIRDILETGVTRPDRTGMGTRSKFGVTMRFNLRNSVLPLLTTKRVFWRGVAEELLWFIAGCTDARVLQAKGIRIWDGNASREFLDSLGLKDREVGDLGPVYGFQWRHFGAKYVDCHTDYTGQGVDQLAAVIQTLKTNPTDRRILLSAWNPADLKLMALPPCHMFCQFYVANGELSCQMYQRSADMGLGVPFNIASYALLTRLIAQVTGLKPGEFIHVIGDAHVYLNHVDALKEQLTREPYDFPLLTIDPTIMDIDQFRYEHFTVHGYRCHAAIKMDMAV